MRRPCVFIAFFFCWANAANACLMQGADIIHCAPKALSNFMFAPFGENKCGDNQYLEEARKEYEELALSETEVSDVIHGKTYRGRKKDLETLKEMTSHGRVPEKAKVALSECEEVFCALDKIFGSRESAYRSLSIARDSGYIVSIEQTTKDDDYLWSVEDLRDISYSTNILPKYMLNQVTMDRFEILPPNYSFTGEFENSAGIATSSYSGNGKISLKNFDRTDKNWPSMVIIHEMAHHFDYSDGGLGSKPFVQSSGFLNLNGWKEQLVWEEKEGKQVQVKKWAHKEDACFPRDYAGTSPEEDFSEAVAYYVNRPYFLKTKCPNIYSFMKERVFKGREYLQDGVKGQVHRMIDLDPSLKQCVSAEYQGLAVGENEIKFEIVSKEGNYTNWKSHGRLKTKIKDECLSKIRASIDLTNEGQSCSKRFISANTDEDIADVFEARYGDQYRELLQKTYGRREFMEAFDRCMDIKDVRASCVTKEMRAQITQKGFSAPEITSFRGQIGIDRLMALGFDSKKALVSCVAGRGSALKKYLERKDNSNSCWWEVTDVFEANGIEFSESDIIYSFSKAVFDEDNQRLLEFIKDEFTKKGRASVIESCGEVPLRECVSKKIKARSELDEESAWSLAKAIDGAL